MQTVDFIEDIVTQMTPTITIDLVVDNGDGTQTISTCDTYWIRQYLIVTIDSIDYEVSSFVKDTSFTIPSTPSLVTADSFTLNAPYYFHGSPMQVNNEKLAIKNDSNKYPLIYLVESLTDSFYDELDGKEKDMGLRMFFLDSFNSKNDEVDAHYTNRIVPLNSSLNYFVELLKANSYTLPFSYDVTNRIKVGVYTTNQGYTDEVFSDPLDGVEFVSTVTLLKGYVCKCI
jgi:hypothetical protein